MNKKQILYNELYTLSKGKDFSFKAQEVIKKLKSLNNTQTFLTRLHELEKDGMVRLEMKKGRNASSTIHFNVKGIIDENLINVTSLPKAQALKEITGLLKELNIKRNALKELESYVSSVARKYCLDGTLTGADVLKIRKRVYQIA